MMNRLYICFALLAIIFVLNGADMAQTGATTETQTIMVQVLDGRNGKPMARARILFVIGQLREPLNRFGPDITTDKDGFATLTINPTETKWLRPFVEFHKPCISKTDIATFNVEEIIAKGIAMPDKCGKFMREPTPGHLIIFARPAHFLEKMKW